MARRKLIAANWKMHKTNAELGDFFSSFRSHLTGPVQNVDVLFALPYTLLAKAAELVKNDKIVIAAQNMHFEHQGAYTGEIAAPMLKEIGVTATLVGHSERRQYFAETDVTVAKKVKVCLHDGILPVACVGETRKEREENQTAEVLKRQMKAILDSIETAGNLVIAYEPVWAIGTGLTATTAQAQEAHALIRKLLGEKFGKAKAEEIRILYGGSAKAANIKELLLQPDIDGGLVGGASLVANEFAQMVSIAASLGLGS